MAGPSSTRSCEHRRFSNEISICLFMDHSLRRKGSETVKRSGHVYAKIPPPSFSLPRPRSAAYVQILQNRLNSCNMGLSAHPPLPLIRHLARDHHQNCRRNGSLNAFLPTQIHKMIRTAVDRGTSSRDPVSGPLFSAAPRLRQPIPLTSAIYCVIRPSKKAGCDAQILVRVAQYMGLELCRRRDPSGAERKYGHVYLATCLQVESESRWASTVVHRSSFHYQPIINLLQCILTGPRIEYSCYDGGEFNLTIATTIIGILNKLCRTSSLLRTYSRPLIISLRHKVSQTLSQLIYPLGYYVFLKTFFVFHYSC